MSSLEYLPAIPWGDVGYVLMSGVIIWASLSVSRTASMPPNRYRFERAAPVPIVALVVTVGVNRYVVDVGALGGVVLTVTMAYVVLGVAIQIYYDGLGPWEGVA